MSIQKPPLAKPEFVSAPTRPLSDSNAIDTISRVMLRFEGGKVAGNVEGHTLGGKPMIDINLHTSTSFPLPAASSDTSGTPIAPPAHEVLWRDCGFDETIRYYPVLGEDDLPASGRPGGPQGG